MIDYNARFVLCGTIRQYVEQILDITGLAERLDEQRMEMLIRLVRRVSYPPVIEQVEIIAINAVYPVNGFLKLLLLLSPVQNLPLRAYRLFVISDRYLQTEILYQLPCRLIRR